MSTEVAKKPYDIVATVQSKVEGYVQRGEMILPPNYAVGNSLKSAYLVLQETMNKDKVPVLEACTQASIANALLDMCVQGLNPGKKQGDFIAYGKKLSFQRSYFGTQAVTKRVVPNVDDIFSEPVYGGDELEYAIECGRKYITKHHQKIENVRPDNIIAAYCIVTFTNEKQPLCDIMTFEQIKQSWKKSKANPVNADGSLKPGTVHYDHPDRMSRRTIINRLCVPLINASSDDHLFLESFNRANEISTEYDIEQEIDDNANGEIIDVTAMEVKDLIIVVCPKCKAEYTDEPDQDEAIEKTGQCLVCHEADEKGPGF